MRRRLVDPRPEWERIVTEQGLIFPVTPLADGTSVPYWNEAAWYEFSMTEVLVLEAATEELWAMCLDAAGYLAATATDRRLGLPTGSLELIRDSIRRGDQAVYARFDLAPTGTDLAAGSPVRMLEINGDTPTGLVETGVAQWRWVEEVMPGSDQWNSVHDRLVRRWRDLAESGALDGDVVHFLYLDPQHADDAGEMEMTVHYMLDCAVQAGLRTVAQPIEHVGWDRVNSVFVDRAGNEIRNAFKLYPWELMLDERFGRLLLDRAETRRVNWFEPAWKALLSTKAILPVLWERNPGHPLLLPAYFDSPGDLTEWVAKPLHGREGDNIRVHRAGAEDVEMPGGVRRGGLGLPAVHRTAGVRRQPRRPRLVDRRRRGGRDAGPRVGRTGHRLLQPGRAARDQRRREPGRGAGAGVARRTHRPAEGACPARELMSALR